MSRGFTVLAAPLEIEPDCKVKCDNCGEEFWISPIGEENLVFNGKCLVELCPRCGAEGGK